jgi:hypothetical protein
MAFIEHYTVADLIKKLQEYPMNSKLDIRFASSREEKVIMVASGHELDPVFQVKKPTIHGFGPI